MGNSARRAQKLQARPRAGPHLADDDVTAAPADESDRAAERRDEAATARDDAATARDVVAGTGDGDQAASDRESAARDRDAAAKDRRHAALDRHGAEDQLQQSYRDGLTGLLLRDAGCDELGRAFARAQRIREPLVLAFVDVDHLKAVNDLRGHAGGDDVLRAVGVALRDGLRAYDVVMRYGGDEFLCAFVGAHVPEVEDRLNAVAAALTEAVAEASFSFGLAELTGDVSLDDLIALADHDMYARRRSAL